MSAATTLPLRRLTFDEWVALPEDEPGELVDGVLVEEEMPSLVHEAVVAFLIEALRVWLRAHGGVVFGSGVKLRVGARLGRIPDTCVYFAEKISQLPRHGAVAIPPDIVVEVVSSTPRDEQRDRIEKLEEYAAFGVRWYWLVAPERQLFEIYELGADGRYVHARGATIGRIEQVPGCEGLSIDLDALWREVARIGEPIGN